MKGQSKLRISALLHLFSHYWRTILYCILLVIIFSCEEGKPQTSDEKEDKPLVSGEKENPANPRKSEPIDTDITLTDLGICPPSEITYWQSIINTQLGVHGVNPPNEGDWINYTSLRKHYTGGITFINNWFPLSPEKMVFCGRLEGYNVFQESKGADWNFYMSPALGFENFINLAKPFKGSCGLLFFLGDKWHKCSSNPTNYCLEGEVSPHYAYNGWPWFPIPDPNPSKYGAPPSLVNKDICLYGPWVRECVHQHRPEIHPSELVWWRDNSDNSFNLMVVQDASNRFGFQSRYVGSHAAPWKPWAENPISAIFIIPFELNPATNDVLIFNIDEKYSINVSTDATKAEDSDDGASHSLRLDGIEKVRINENQARDEDLGIKYVNLCKRSGGRVQGYVQIMLQIGKDVKDNEGLYLMKIDTQTVPASLVNPMLVKSKQLSPKKMNKPHIAIKPKTIRPITLNGKTVLLADYEIKIFGEEEVDRNQLSR